MTQVFRKLATKDLVVMAMIVAISVILQRFSFGTEIVKFGFGFIGTVLLAYYFGPFWGGIGAGIADLVSSALFGGGTFFPGFTVSAVLAAVIYGIFFYQQPLKIWRVMVAVLLVTLIVNVLLNTTWLTIMYGQNFWAALIVRAPKQLIAPWFQMLMIWLILTALQRAKISIK